MAQKITFVHVPPSTFTRYGLISLTSHRDRCNVPNGIECYDEEGRKVSCFTSSMILVQKNKDVLASASSHSHAMDNVPKLITLCQVLHSPFHIRQVPLSALVNDRVTLTFVSFKYV